MRFKAEMFFFLVFFFNASVKGGEGEVKGKVSSVVSNSVAHEVKSW